MLRSRASGGDIFEQKMRGKQLAHDKLGMQRTGGADAFQNVDHVAGCHAQRVQPGHHI